MVIDNLSLQIQSIIYKNDKKSLIKTIDSLFNAIKVSIKNGMNVKKINYYYGDASPKKTFTQHDIKQLNKKYGNYIKINYFFFNKNVGHTLGQNLIFKKYWDHETEFLMILNPDVVVSPVFFEKIFVPFKKKIDCGLTEARQTPIEHHKAYNLKTFETDWATGACFIVYAKLFSKLNGFDSNTFYMYCDDVDFSWRLRLLGKKIYYVPSAVVFHQKTFDPDNRFIPSPLEKEYSAKAALLMAYKWSNMKLVNKICKIFDNSDDPILKDAVNHYYMLRKKKKLPKQIYASKIAYFKNGYYSKNRFIV